jgi:Holliday junction resolvase RusA-like endonuclease
MKIKFFAAGVPKGQPRPRAFARQMGGKMVARVYDAGTAEGWKSAVALAARPYLPKTPLQGPIEVQITYYFPRPQSHYGKRKGELYLKPDAPRWHTGKPDIDNADKAIMDALTTLGMWVDDAQVVSMMVEKRYSETQGVTGATIEIEGLIA